MKESMSAFIRYPLLGCLALSLIACGSSGSQTLLAPPSQLPTVTYNTVDYLLKDSAAITAAWEKFTSNSAEETDATRLTSLGINPGGRMRSGTRYLSTGSMLVEGDGSTFTTKTVDTASCHDRGTSQAYCTFPADTFRDETTIEISALSVDRQPVMKYRGVEMSQVRRTGTDTKTGADDEKTRKNYEYVGYDGILRYSMFFVGVYQFFDTTGTGENAQKTLRHLRFENASLGHIYDQDGMTRDTIDNPSIRLTGDGVMVGMESENGTRNRHLVQGDVEIEYTTFPDEIDIDITNIKRLVGSGTAWYADPTRIAVLDWDNVGVTGSKFSAPSQESQAELLGSFYGTPDTNTESDEDNGVYEVGGTFHHVGSQYSIFGAFGAPLKSDAQQE
ncbi:MAG: hypothetical protein OXH88_03845 [Gammaproteobacteria bacterium]|nr:hypothetical protein [Gammaproteobacteria bacterium]